MSTDAIVVTGKISATPEQIFEAWLNAAQHAAMTGGAATGSGEVGSAFTAWDGYITGKNLSQERPHRIVQAWRSAEFPKGSESSHLEVELDGPAEGPTTVTIRHSNIPAGQGKQYETGWVDHYLTPMQAYFGRTFQDRS